MEENDFLSVIDILGRSIGLRGLARILSSLSHYMQKNKKNAEKDCRVDTFVSLLKSYLVAHEGESAEFIALPDLVKLGVVKYKK